MALCGAIAVAVCGHYGIFAFLAITAPVKGEFLVVEGWIPAYAMKEAVAWIRDGNYRKVLVSGCAHFDEWSVRGQDTYAEWGASTLRRQGVEEDLLVPVPCLVERKDRTYSSAVEVGRWLEANGVQVGAIDVFTLGPHARRSRLLFKRALGRDVRVGVIAAEPRQYDPGHWWRSSEGVREVLGEGVAYLYARCFFSPQESGTTRRAAVEMVPISEAVH